MQAAAQCSRQTPEKAHGAGRVVCWYHLTGMVPHGENLDSTPRLAQTRKMKRSELQELRHSRAEGLERREQ